MEEKKEQTTVYYNSHTQDFLKIGNIEAIWPGDQH